MDLIEYRVKSPENMNYRALNMTQEQILNRRATMRQILRNTSFNNLNNAQMDNSALLPIEEGYLFDDPSGYEYFIPKASISAAETDFRRTRSMMPFEFIGKTGNDFDWNNYDDDISYYKNIVSNYITDFQKFKEDGMGLYIYSKTKGSGKTMLSCCILNEVIKRNAISVKFVNMLDFIDMTKRSFNGQQDELNQITNAKLLVLDDIGVQMSKEWIDTVLYQLVNKRYVERLPTIYTSNLPVDRLKMDDRITDRIENTTFEINLPEVPVRKIKRQQDKQMKLDEIMKKP